MERGHAYHDVRLPRGIGAAQWVSSLAVEY